VNPVARQNGFDRKNWKSGEFLLYSGSVYFKEGHFISVKCHTIFDLYGSILPSAGRIRARQGLLPLSGGIGLRHTEPATGGKVFPPNRPATQIPVA
jgi:hypothetical protein